LYKTSCIGQSGRLSAVQALLKYLAKELNHVVIEQNHLNINSIGIARPFHFSIWRRLTYPPICDAGSRLADFRNFTRSSRMGKGMPRHILKAMQRNCCEKLVT
jgi:hypothetical protein